MVSALRRRPVEVQVEGIDSSTPQGGFDTIRGEPLIYTEGLYSIEFAQDLQEWEMLDAWNILRWFKGNGPFFGIAGTMLISAPPRQGKDLFLNTLGWKIKRYFPHKRILRDEHPTPLFGEYTYFNEDAVMRDVAGMSEIADQHIEKTKKKDGTYKVDAKLKEQIGEWVSSQGQIMMQDSVCMKTEFWKDMNRRRPMSPMNLILGGFMKMSYHTDTLIAGIIQRVNDLDRFTCLPFVNLHAKCAWCTTIEDTTQVTMHHVQWSEAEQRLIPITKKPVVIYVDGGRPRAELGGKRYFDLFVSKSAPNISGLGSKSYMDLMRAKKRITEAVKQARKEMTEE